MARLPATGDTRGALAPFLAYMHYTEHEHAVPFKWILYGDDDTQFYMRGGGVATGAAPGGVRGTGM